MTTKRVYRCSNLRCASTFDADPQGPCPLCVRKGWGNWSCIAHIITSLNDIKPIPPVDRTQQTLTEGSPPTPDHREIDPKTGMQKGYVVLTEAERAKGFVRPVRSSYVHVGLPAPKNPLHDLTPEQHKRYNQFGYVKFEQYPDSDNSVTGKYWTQAELDKIDKGCKTKTTMGSALAETYARDPKFYGGTFCCGCKTHFPVEEFVWLGTSERVGS